MLAFRSSAKKNSKSARRAHRFKHEKYRTMRPRSPLYYFNNNNNNNNYYYYYYY